MRKFMWFSSVALILVAALSSCQKKTDTLSETTSDSLLASNPMEQPEGSLAPQTEYQPPAETEPAAETPKPAARPPARRPSSSSPAPSRTPAEPAGVTMAAGTPINISVTSQISSEHVGPGDTWSGEVKEPVIVGNEVVIPAGSRVNGVVEGAMAAEKGSRAFLVLGVRSIEANGRTFTVDASTDSIIAGSPRARNLGAIAGGTAAGALIGKAVGGGGKGALIGGLIGGAAATGAVAKSKGFQVVIKEGTVITFNTDRKVTVRT